MMLRPVLLINSDFDSQPPAAAMCPPPINSDIESDMLIKARAMCLNIAQILLRVIETNMNAQNNSLPPPWYTVFCKPKLGDLNIRARILTDLPENRHSYMCRCLVNSLDIFSITRHTL
jgi:hypothetical protein